MYLACDDKKVKIYDLVNSCVYKEIEESQGEVKAIEIHEPSNLMVTGSIDSKVRVFNLKTGELKKIYEGH